MRGLWSALILAACSKDVDPGAGAVGGAETGDDQTPPTGAANLEAWLAQGVYKSWACEAAPHTPRSPSPHRDTDRVCSNALLSQTADGAYPVGAASVKEIFGGDGKPSGYAVYRKVGIGGGESWYWYERVAGKLNADGIGSSGDVQSECVDCHAAAHDFVFTRVKSRGL